MSLAGINFLNALAEAAKRGGDRVHRPFLYVQEDLQLTKLLVAHLFGEDAAQDHRFVLEVYDRVIAERTEHLYP